MLCSLLVLLVLVVLVRSGLPVPAVLVLVLVLFVLVLFVPAVLSVVVLTVLAVLVLVDSRLLAVACCAANGSGPTRASRSSIGSIARGAPCWRTELARLCRGEVSQGGELEAVLPAVRGGRLNGAYILEM